MALIKTEIDKERIKKQNFKIYIISAIVLMVYVFLTFLHYGPVAKNNPRLDIFECIFKAMGAIITDPLNISFNGFGMFMLIILFGGCFGLMMYTAKNSMKGANLNEESSFFMTPKIIKQFNTEFAYPFDGTPTNKWNLQLSDDLGLFIDNAATNLNQNILVIGGAGSGKSFRVVAPNLLKCNSNYVITDPSGELYNKYSKYLEDNGYKIKVFNLTNMYQSNRYNPLKYIQSEKDVFDIVDAFIKSRQESAKQGSGEKFWTDTEKILLQAIMLYLWHTTEEEKSMADVVNLVNQADVDEENPDATQSELDKKFASLEREDPDNLAVKQYKAFKKAAGKTLKSIIISVLADMESFMLEDMAYLTAYDEMDFEHFGDSKQALFVIIPSDRSTFNFMAALMYTQLFQTLYNYGESRVRYGWRAIIGEKDKLAEREVIKVVQAQNAEDSKRAENEINAFIEKIKTEGLSIRENKTKHLFEVQTKKTKEIIGWRGTKEQAVAFIESLKRLKATQCPPEKSPIHIQFMLDEFSNIGQIPEFDKKLSTMRKYDIACTIILQAMSQLDTLYDKAAETIIGNCDTKIYLGCNDEKTNKFFSDACGKRYIKIKNTSDNGKSGGSSSINNTAVELMPTYKMTKLDRRSQCIVILPGQHPYFGLKCRTNLMPEFKNAMSTSGTFVFDGDSSAKATNSRHVMKSKAESAKVSMSIKAQMEKDAKSEKVNAIRTEAEIKQQKEIKDMVQSFVDSAGEDFKTTSKEQAEALLSSFGLSKNSTDDEIKETVESIFVGSHFIADTKSKFSAE